MEEPTTNSTENNLSARGQPLAHPTDKSLHFLQLEDNFLFSALLILTK